MPVSKLFFIVLVYVYSLKACRIYQGTGTVANGKNADDEIYSASDLSSGSVLATLC